MAVVVVVPPDEITFENAENWKTMDNNHLFVFVGDKVVAEFRYWDSVRRV